MANITWEDRLNKLWAKHTAMDPSSLAFGAHCGTACRYRKNCRTVQCCHLVDAHEDDIGRKYAKIIENLI